MLGGFRERTAPLLAAMVIPAVLAVGGCGDGEDSTADDQPTLSAAAERPSVFMKRLAKLLSTTTTASDCPQLQQINLRSFVRFACPPGKELRASMKSFRIIGTEEYGTGGIVDYTSGTVEQGGTIVLFVARDRNWGVSRFGILTEPSTDTTDEDSRDGFAEAVDEFVRATRAHDCKAIEEVAFVDDLKGKDKCKQVVRRFEQFTRQVRSHPNAEAEYIGGNASYGFFSLETTKPDENTTISVVKGTGDDPYVVLDAGPSPTSLQQQGVREQIERQQREARKTQAGDQTETGPSPVPKK